MAVNGFEVEVPVQPYPQRTVATAASVFRPLEGPRMVENGAQRWLNGAYWIELGCPTLIAKPAAEGCDEAIVSYSTPTNVEDVGDDNRKVFHAIRAEFALGYSTICGMPRDELQTYVDQAVDLGSSAVLARQVMFGAYDQTMPFLAGEAEDVTTTDTTPAGALAAVEDGLAQLMLNGVGMIHMRPGMLIHLEGKLEKDDGVWRTPTGHEVVADAGYSGIGAVPNQQHVYGSPPVHYRWTGAMPVGTGWDGVDELLKNKRTLRVERYMLAMFETCPVVRARVDTGTVPNLAGGL